MVERASRLEPGASQSGLGNRGSGRHVTEGSDVGQRGEGGATVFAKIDSRIECGSVNWMQLDSHPAKFTAAPTTYATIARQLTPYVYPERQH